MLLLMMLLLVLLLSLQLLQQLLLLLLLLICILTGRLRGWCLGASGYLTLVVVFTPAQVACALVYSLPGSRRHVLTTRAQRGRPDAVGAGLIPACHQS